MVWLRRHGWWGLFAVSVMLILFGSTDIASGAAADELIPQGLTGRTIEDLEAESPDAFGTPSSPAATLRAERPTRRSAVNMEASVMRRVAGKRRAGTVRPEALPRPTPAQQPRLPARR